MLSKTVVLYATDTMADWEYSYLAAGLGWAAEADPDGYRLRVCGDGAEEVVTKGRLHLRTDGALDDVDPAGVALLVLPGADTWGAGHDTALGLAARLLGRGTPVAAICGATLALARVGLLDGRAHTSNSAAFLATTGYAGGAHYRDEPVVDDGGLVTAAAARPVDFAAAVFRRLELFPPAMIDAWYGLYTTGRPEFFDAMTAAGAS